jgi:hypothetical protein
VGCDFGICGAEISRSVSAGKHRRSEIARQERNDRFIAYGSDFACSASSPSRDPSREKEFPKHFGLHAQAYGTYTYIDVESPSINEKSKATAHLMTYWEMEHPTAPHRRWEKTIILPFRCQNGHPGNGHCFASTEDHLLSKVYDWSGWTEHPSKRRYTQEIAVELDGEWLIADGDSHNFKLDLELQKVFGAFFLQKFETDL